MILNIRVQRTDYEIGGHCGVSPHSHSIVPGGFEVAS
jgi:hypothetical protein